MKLSVNKRGSGEPLLMIHGIISDGSFFDEAAKELAGSCSVITYDRRGYGNSEADEEGHDYTVASQAEDAAEILREYASEKAWIFGNSAGGLIGVELAIRHPELVRGLVLLEPSLIFDDESRAMMAAWNGELNNYVKENRIKQAMPAFSRMIDASSPERGRTPARSMTMAEMRMAYHNLTNFMYGELNEVQTYFPDLETVKSVAVPACILVSEDGTESMFAKTSLAGASYLGWPVKKVPGNHNAVREESSAFADKLKSILEEWR